MTILQVFKKFFIDDPIARTKKVYFWIFNYIGMRFSILFVPFYYWYILRPLRVGDDGRVGMLQLNTEINFGCNLRCEFCSVFSPHLQGVVPADELLNAYAQWRKKINPEYIIFSGGEPFLHPELARVVRESAEIWNESRLWLTTNGLLLERAKPDVLQAIKESGCKVIVTEHTFEHDHRKKLDAGYKRLKQEKIPFVIRPSRSTWLALYRYDEKGGFVPYKGNPKKAWNNCKFRACTTLFGDRLYKCSLLAHVYHTTQKGVLDSELWQAALTYKPLTLDSTPEEIVEHLRQRVVPECTICPDKPIIVPARQMPLERVTTSE